MADISTTFTDADQAAMAARAKAAKDAMLAAIAAKPSRYWKEVVEQVNANAIWLEDKIGLPAGTLQGSRGGATTDSGGTPCDGGNP